MRLFESLGVDEKSISSLTELEVRSAIRRRERSGDLTQTNAEAALSALAIEAAGIRPEPITAAILKKAATVIDGQGLRALDAIQLATALLLDQAGDARYRVQFITFDERLLLAAEAQVLSTWKPALGRP